MINNTTLVGRLTKNPELKYTGSGIAVLSFNLAVERNYKDASGEKQTDFINCVVWRGTAETLASFAVKGSLIGITGAIQTRNYQNNEGQTVYITEVVVNNFQMLESKNVTDERRSQMGDQQQDDYQNNSYNNQNNNQQQQQNNNQTQNNNDYKNDRWKKNENAQTDDGVPEVSDDDLPF